MEYIKINNTDLIVSRLCLGCMGFGNANMGQHSWTVSQEQTDEIVKTALENGINFFDTASAYQNGSGEETLGKALKKYAKREDIVLATKFIPRTPEERKTITSKDHIKKSLDDSLRRLAATYVDLYIYHMWDYFTPIEEVMEALNEVVESKKARYIGISNCFAWQLQKANDYAKSKGWAKFVSVQNHYNLLNREEEREMIPCCLENDIAITPYSPLASGRLVKSADDVSKRLLEDAYAKKKYDKTAMQDKIIIDRVKEIAAIKNLTQTQVVFAWLFAKNTIPIFGATKVKHIIDAVSSIEVELTTKEIEYLEEAYIPHTLVGVMADNNGKSVYRLPKREKH